MIADVTLAEKNVRIFLAHWNNKNLKGCMQSMTDDVEMRSTLAYKLIHESNGIIKGKKTLESYFALLMQRFPDFILENQEYTILSDSIIVKSLNPTGTYYFHVQYYFKSDGKIYMLKSDTTEA